MSASPNGSLTATSSTSACVASRQEGPVEGPADPAESVDADTYSHRRLLQSGCATRRASDYSRAASACASCRGSWPAPSVAAIGGRDRLDAERRGSAPRRPARPVRRVVEEACRPGRRGRAPPAGGRCRRGRRSRFSVARFATWTTRPGARARRPRGSRARTATARCSCRATRRADDLVGARDRGRARRDTRARPSGTSRHVVNARAVPRFGDRDLPGHAALADVGLQRHRLGRRRQHPADRAEQRARPRRARPARSPSVSARPTSTRLPSAWPASSPAPKRCSNAARPRAVVARRARRRHCAGRRARATSRSRRSRPEEPPSSATLTTAVISPAYARMARSATASPCPPPSATTAGASALTHFARRRGGAPTRDSRGRGGVRRAVRR